MLWQGDASGATGMIKELRPWLESVVFNEADSSSNIYIQRPFTNPAGSPFYNGREIGWSKWEGDNKCSQRRSLIEEAQEVKAESRDSLVKYRSNPELRDSLPPSRNILIAHSMGGLASREYVQGDDYKNDVDKVITLDSPHKGTHSLDGLLHMKEWIMNPAKDVAVQKFSTALAFGIAMIAFDKGPLSDQQALLFISEGIGWVNGINALVSAGTDLALGYAYEESDPLVPYIRPGSSALNRLNSKAYTNNLPMMRILSSEGGLTFGSDKEYGQSTISYVVPDALYVPVKNSVAQISHTEIDNPAYLSNIIASISLGLLGGFSLTDHGSALIPWWSGSAQDVSALHDQYGNSKFYIFAANEKASVGEVQAANILLSAMAGLGTASALGFFNPAVAKVTRLAIAGVVGATLAGYMVPSTIAAIKDMQTGHRMPTLKEYQFKWHGTANAYTTLLGERLEYEPYLMEEFLYEKPFVNIKVKSHLNDKWEDRKKDVLGLYGNAGSDDMPLVDTLDLSAYRKLSFNSGSEWEAMGAKKERWTTDTKGVVDEKIPIRHADRYAMPPFMVGDFIKRYEFEVDDLMPHKLRQIRINFNFNEDIAWECQNYSDNVSSCQVYKRTPASPEWQFVKLVSHPVQKNGTFIFEPGEFYSPENGGTGLGSIQKDNQNTVTITTVNKIGLTNNQRFYYLFKATADLLEPYWPQRDIKISSLNGFKAYASTLSYQGLEALGGMEHIVPDPINSESCKSLPPTVSKEFSNIEEYDGGYLLKSQNDYGKLTQNCRYIWKMEIETGNPSDATTHSTSNMDVPFKLDTTPPEITLSASNKSVLNKDSVTFLAHFTNDADIDESLKLAVFFLKKVLADKDSTIGTAKFNNVLASEFGLTLSDFKDDKTYESLDTLPDGKYKIVGYGFDGSTGSFFQYDLLNQVVDGVLPQPPKQPKPSSSSSSEEYSSSTYLELSSSSDEYSSSSEELSSSSSFEEPLPKSSVYNLFDLEKGEVIEGIIAGKAETTFIVDAVAPEFDYELSGLIMNQDKLLTISMDVSDRNAKDSAVVGFSVLFEGDRDTLRLGDTLLLRKEVGKKEWKEQEAMSIPDGDYNITVSVWDEAGNMAKKKYADTLRIDRLAPTIVEVMSSQLIYHKDSTNYSAIMYVEQHDRSNHLRKMSCKYRINKGEWQNIPDTLANKSEKQELRFNINKNIVGAEEGIRYLDAGCKDWAGNFDYTEDIFNIGVRSPIISYPTTSIEESVFAIRGIAPPRSSGDDSASYMLEWRKWSEAGDAEWQNIGVDVGVGKRSADSSPWLSNSAMPAEGDLGFLNMGNSETGTYELRLSVRDCPECDWRMNSIEFYYSKPTVENENENKLHFSLKDNNRFFVPDSSVLNLSLKVDGAANLDWRTRIFARDSKGILFETSNDKLPSSPYEGAPSSFDGEDGKGIWFWSENEEYNLRWEGLPEGEEIILFYAKGSFDESLCATIQGCSLEDRELPPIEEFHKNTDGIELPFSAEIPLEMRAPEGLNRAMVFKGNSGNVQFKNDNVFWVKFMEMSKAADLENKLPVYLGKGGSNLETMVSILGGTLVNPNDLYVLNYEWNGMASNSRYPQGRKVTFFAEAVENMSGKVLRDSIEVLIRKPKLEITSDSEDLDDFYIFENDSTLGKKTFNYGIKGRDAIVSAWVKDEEGSIVRTLFENESHSASRSNNYSLAWDATTDREQLKLEQGKYYFEIKAKESSGRGEPQIDSLKKPFEISFREGVKYITDDPDIPSTSSLSLLHATPLDAGRWQYTPVADYLVQANASGRTLHDSLRKIGVEWNSSGTQSVYGFPPQRFSFAVKRQRKELPLVIVAKPYLAIVSQKCNMTGSTIGHGYLDTSFYYNIVFKENETKDFNLKLYINEIERGFDEDKPNKIYMYAYTKNSETDAGKYDTTKAVWKSVVDLPMSAADHKYDKKDTTITKYGKKDNRCTPKNPTENLAGTTCEHPNVITEDKYNPNRNLFDYKVKSNNANGYFFDNMGEINNGCTWQDDKRFELVDLNIKLTIPDEYWNAEVGYDNLVNRTIRIDQTNSTMYGGEGYLRQVADSVTSKRISFEQGKTYWNGEKWLSNYNYGMATPFEVHRIPFISVSTISSNNAFSFPDETADARYQYPSYFLIKQDYNINKKVSFRIKPSANSTTLVNHGDFEVLVYMDAQLSDFAQDTIQIPYPASDDWIKEDVPKEITKCPEYNDASFWSKEKSNQASCKKFYESGSKVHHNVGDFDDSVWKAKMTKDGATIANRANKESSFTLLYPFAKITDTNADVFPIACKNLFDVNPKNYTDYKEEKWFYIETDCFPPAELTNVKATYTPKLSTLAPYVPTIVEDSLYNDSLEGGKINIYLKSSPWDSVSYLRLLDNSNNMQGYPKHNEPKSVHIREFFDVSDTSWAKEHKLTDAKVLHLDTSSHTHFSASPKDDKVEVSVKTPPDSLRPSEFIAIKGYVKENFSWKLSYLNNGKLEKLANGNSNDEFTQWFNVNRLQGNTSILLQWGSSDGTLLNIRKLDLDIGASLKSEKEGTVQSLFGEVSVHFPPGAVKDSSGNGKDTVVTVRTANPKDYAYETSTGSSAILGPVVEVLPSMQFTDTNSLPRIKSRISNAELTAMKIRPEEVRLYKIDTKNKKLIVLQNTLLGFLYNGDAEDKEPNCNPEKNNCEAENETWSHLIISAETQTFSLFAALDKASAELFNEDPVVEPEIIPSEIICSVSTDSLWLGLDNGHLELPQLCNQSAMGTLQIRKDGNIIAEHNQMLPDTLRWNGQLGMNKIPHGTYSSRYLALGTTGLELQTVGPTIYTDTLRPVISGFSVAENTIILDREFSVKAKITDDLSGIGSVRLRWSFGTVMGETVEQSVDSTGNINYALYLSQKQLAQCPGCRLSISLYAEDKGRNHTAEEWKSEILFPYPSELALWYPALEGAGKTAKEYVGTGHDLNLEMKTPWLSASGIYFEKSEDKAAGKGQVALGEGDSYTIESWIRPGYTSGTAWQRVLGFESVVGKNLDLQVKGKDVRLVDGDETWTVTGLLQQAKVWSHLVIAVNTQYANFYIDGKLAGTIFATPSERMWFGNFSLGTDSYAPAFTGHIMQVRLYKKALSTEEIKALFQGNSGDGSYVEIALADGFNWIEGMERGFSCAVPGSSYWDAAKEIPLSWNAWVNKKASYKVFLYARSAQPGEKTIRAGIYGSALSAATITLENVWRPVELQNLVLNLNAGSNDLRIQIPEGVDIAGIALSDNMGLLPYQITWNAGDKNSSKIIAQARFEGHPDPSMIRPRVRLKNTGSSTIFGPKVRYYFRGEDPSQVQAYKYFPQEGNLVIRQDGSNLGYAEWSFPYMSLQPGQEMFYGDGPHFGLHNTNYVPWIFTDDPSFAEGSSSAFVDAPGVVLLDSENKVWSGSCFEDEAPIITTPVVQVAARDARSDNQASHLYIKLENIGQIPVKDYELRYSFYVSGNATPILDIYDMQGLTASLKELGEGRWQVIINGKPSLGPGISWANLAQFALHLPGWQSGWDSGDDPSHEGISGDWMLAKGIEVYDAGGNRIYGKEPVWTETIEENSAPVYEYSYSPYKNFAQEENNSHINITRLPEGLLLTLVESSQLSLELVNVNGTPQGSLYQGVLSTGEHIIPADWSKIDIARTYLVARLNGQIISNQIISNLRN